MSNSLVLNLIGILCGIQVGLSLGTLLERRRLIKHLDRCSEMIHQCLCGRVSIDVSSYKPPQSEESEK